MNNIAQETAVYEFPLNERLRYFLRYEDIIQSVNHYLALKDDIAVLKDLQRLINFIGNHDLRSELLQQLDRQKNILHAYAKSENIDQEKLSGYIKQNESALAHLHEFRISQTEYYNHAFLTNALRQLALQSGMCGFDFPQLQIWKQTPWEVRQNMLVQWVAPFLEFADDMSTCLDLTRKSGDFTMCRAKKGYFSDNPPETSDDLQMIRLRLTPNPLCYPVVSAGAQLINIHFMSQANFAIPADKISENIQFELAYCVI